jgi:uncharacterized hydrophobic protein (TIGR00271 family)
MLVAPLFSPILAISMSIVQGDVRLLRIAIEAALKGIVLAIGVGILITAISPLRSIGGEITARVAPNLFDLAVALASGAAGAYAIARKDVAASLPGVAIAAALVPPLCVVGIGLAAADMQIAGGGGLLFITNLVAIVLAGTIALLLLGFRPAERGERTERLRRGLVVSLILLLIISIPLAIVFLRSAEQSRLHRSVHEVVSEEIEPDPELELLDFETEKIDGQVEVAIRVYAQEQPTSAKVEGWREALSHYLGEPVRIRVVSIGATLIQSSP